jgi:hypothetical protein
MMRFWADYLDEIREGGKIIPIRAPDSAYKAGHQK